ncbi:Pentatricopeptide repeat-containing protein [Actinidia chinensis var. chinensis]|uniref:Pentatricopeptide repeat-containing protein n=1 Tax=Actinidia chinensis var. chinensis TaxID=1590841 RepID=A0A2R6RYC9_ACTCC|nr:Pentatricopeptide repeat-containing protein [Actinidia chinensis var. chinensis]
MQCNLCRVCIDIDEAILLFSQMRHLGLSPDDIPVRSLLSACTSPATLNQEQKAHNSELKIRVGSTSNRSCGVSSHKAIPLRVGKCSTLVLTKENHKEDGNHYHVGILNSSAQRYSLVRR